MDASQFKYNINHNFKLRKA